MAETATLVWLGIIIGYYMTKPEQEMAKPERYQLISIALMYKTLYIELGTNRTTAPNASCQHSKHPSSLNLFSYV